MAKEKSAFQVAMEHYLDAEIADNFEEANRWMREAHKHLPDDWLRSFVMQNGRWSKMVEENEQLKKDLRQARRRHWATVIDAIEHGMMGDKERCKAYAEVLLQRMIDGGEDERSIAYLRRVIEGKTQRQTGEGPTYYLTTAERGAEEG